MQTVEKSQQRGDGIQEMDCRDINVPCEVGYVLSPEPDSALTGVKEEIDEPSPIAVIHYRKQG